jgi:hypothetical protein
MVGDLESETSPSLADRKTRLTPGTSLPNRVRVVQDYLHREVRPHIPPATRGKKIAKRKREAILGIGSRGYPE